MLLVTASIVQNNRMRYNCFLLKGFIAPFTTSCYNKSMNKNLKITYFKPTKQGVYPIKNGFSFAEEVPLLSESLLRAGRREEDLCRQEHRARKAFRP